MNEPWVYIQTLRPDQTWTSNCTNKRTGQRIVLTGTTDNAMYCRADSARVSSAGVIQGVIILPLLPLAEMTGGNMWDKGQIPSGNYAAVAMIAHEFSHHIQDEISIWLGAKRPPNPHIELLADCFAGRFLGIWNDSQPFAEGHLGAILLGWGFIGDFDADQKSHGTAEQRQYALELGFYGGADAPGACINQYWPGVTA